VIDIDGTICSYDNETSDYAHANPIVDRIEYINDLYSQGNHITLYTARGMGRHSNNSDAACNEFLELTLDQLTDWGVFYDELFMGKPAGDIYVDDKGMHANDFFCD
jgi:hypothetical protein